MTSPHAPTASRARPSVLGALVAIGLFVAALWAVEVVDVVLGGTLDDEGVQPREQEGLLGILVAPLLHAGWGHLAANSVPLLLLGFLILLAGVGHWLEVTAVVWVVGGVGVWLTGPGNTVHIGASVLVFGWLVHLMVRGLFTRRLGQIALGVVIFLVYGGALWGVLPGAPGVSWQGHLFGAVGGALAAWLTADRRAPRSPAVAG